MERSVKRLMEDREKRREENIKKYIEQLAHESTPYRLRAVEALGACADPRAVDPLVTALNDPENEVRWVVTQALGRLRDDRAVGPLLLLTEPDRWARRGAAWALGRSGIHGHRAPPPLLVDEKKDVRVVVADALGKRAMRVTGILSDALDIEEEPESQNSDSARAP